MWLTAPFAVKGRRTHSAMTCPNNNDQTGHSIYESIMDMIIRIRKRLPDNEAREGRSAMSQKVSLLRLLAS